MKILFFNLLVYHIRYPELYTFLWFYNIYLYPFTFIKRIAFLFLCRNKMEPCQMVSLDSTIPLSEQLYKVSFAANFLCLGLSNRTIKSLYQYEICLSSSPLFLSFRTLFIFFSGGRGQEGVRLLNQFFTFRIFGSNLDSISC